jgi:hypothetical protein
MGLVGVHNNRQMGSGGCAQQQAEVRVPKVVQVDAACCCWTRHLSVLVSILHRM